jgi:TolB-like protein
MSEVFVSYARPNEAEARHIADALRARGWGVWRDDELPPHRAYADVIQERLRSAKAVVVVWTTDAAKSQWVRAEADLARERGVLVQLTLDGSIPPLPFNQIQCADLQGWRGEDAHPAWIKITGSIADLLGAEPAPAAAVQPPTRPTANPVVGVRPFSMVSGADDHGLGAGLTEEIRNSLSRHSTVTVGAARVGAKDDYLLEGSVQQSGERFRVTVKLTAADGVQIWSDRYDGSRADVFELQDRVGLVAGAAIERAIRGVEMERSLVGPEDGLGARQLFDRGIKQMRRYDREGAAEGRRILARVLELEPDHLHALGGMAAACAAAYQFGFYEDGEEDELVRTGMRCGLRALQLSDTDPYATSLAAHALSAFGHEVDAMATLLERIVAFAPSSAFAWTWSGATHLIAGDAERAVFQLKHSLELDPQVPSRAGALFIMGAALVALERYDEARAVLVESIQIRAHTTSSRMMLAVCLARMGRIEEARAALKACAELTPIGRLRTCLRDPEHRRRMCEGLALAGFDKPELVFVAAHE